MDDDFEDEYEDVDADRADQLGFKPQKEVVYNKLLPYGGRQLDEESNAWFAAIKSNLARAVALRDIRPGFVTWSSRLHKYLHFYGFKFSKSEHLALIRLLFAFATEIPELEPNLVSKCANLLVGLLRRKELLGPDELVLPWRPLYLLYERLMFSPYETLGLIHFPGSLESNLRSLIRHCRAYFPPEATSEMLEEWRPLMCPFDVTMGKAMAYFDMFLPTYDAQRIGKEKTYELWFQEFMSFWDACPNSPPWEPGLMALYARLADHNVGQIDWEQYIPVFFTRIQKNFQLPVFFKQTNVAKTSSTMDVTVLCKWIVATMGQGSSTPKYLDQMFQCLESYYHSANYGRHSQKLLEFLGKLTGFFIKRLHRERYAKPRWGHVTEERFRLTDSDVTAFVETLKPIALHSMYSKVGLGEVGFVLQHLATLRPDLMLPPLVERTYDSMATLTEPHKLTASLHAVVSVARSLVHPGGGKPADAPTHVLPLLLATVPGIDPNDMRKSMVAFQFLSTFCTLVPLVDSSDAFNHHTLTEVERTVCGQTAQVDDFVVQFLDRCFALIESSSFEQTREEVSTSDHRSNREETMKDIGMASTFNSILVQSSSDVYNVALKKVQSFVTGRILETKISGKIAASLCRCLCKVRPEKGLKVFLPEAIDKVIKILKEDLSKEETLDDELKFNLLIIAECVRVPGNYLLPFLDSIESILEKSLHFASKEGSNLASTILRNLLRALTIISPTEYRAIPGGYDRPVSEYLPIKDWGRPGNIHDLKLNWHIPTSEEITATQALVDKFLEEELTTLSSFAEGKTELSREQLKTRLGVVGAILHGCASVLPFWYDEEKIKLIETVVDLEPLSMRTTTEDEKQQVTYKGGNARKAIISVMDQVQSWLLKEREDDTRCLQGVVSVFQNALLFGGVTREDYDTRCKSYHAVKRALDNRLVGCRRQIRALLIDRVLLQHEYRMLERSHVPFSSIHAKVIHNLLTLSTSHYSHVRAKAQDSLLRCLSHFSHSYLEILPRLEQLLKEDNDIKHEEFKGALYVILGRKNKSMMTKHSYATLEKLWPAVVEAQHSEKPSIIRLMDWLGEETYRGLDTFGLALNLPETLTNEYALELWRSKSPVELGEFPSQEEIEIGKKRLTELGEKDLASYLSLVEKLTQQVETGTLRWRHQNLALGCICALARYDVPLPARTARMVVRNLINDDITVRKYCIHLLGAILKQQKRKHPKIEINPVSESAKIPSVPGDRPDNEWLCYDPSRLPSSPADWDAPKFVHKTHYGYYTWPKNMSIYAPSDQQPRLDRSREELNDVEKEIHDFFMDSSNVDKLVGFLSLEEHKGKDRFDARRFALFKGLFRNHGDTFLGNFRPHLERLVEDTKESSQRCAAEIIASLIRGSKHWTFESTAAMWLWLSPVLRTALDKVSVETIPDWGTCFATGSESRDPRRIHWMLETLMEDPVRSRGAFNDSSRLYVLQGALAQQEWRAGNLLHRLMSFLRPFCSHPYENVRNRIGSVLTNIMLNDLEFMDKEDKSNKRCPTIAAFFRDVLPMLEVLKEEPDPTLVPGPRTPQDPRMLGNRPMVQLRPNMLCEGFPPGVRPPHPPPMGLSLPAPSEMLARFSLAPEELSKLSQSPGAGNSPLPPEALVKMAESVASEELARLSASVGPLPPFLGPMEPPVNGEVRAGKILDEKTAEYEKRQEAYRLLQTVCKFLSSSLVRAFNSVKPECFELLPVLCINESNELEPQVSTDCTLALACLSTTLLQLPVVPKWLDALETVGTKANSWKAKCAALDVLGTSCFNNMPVLLSNPDWVDRVMNLVLSALEEERVEVRQRAATVLGGLLHCQFVEKDRKEKLLEHFYSLARTKLKRKKKRDEGDQDREDEAKLARRTLKRHSGILGLCAFVSAFPYDVPEFIPNVLMVLSEHLQDPQPINTSIKKTLQEFKRTHQDNWQDHKQKFSEDQVSVLTDLLVSPSYYA